jgi:hypothetical protein
LRFFISDFPQPQPIVFMTKTTVPPAGTDPQINPVLEWNRYVSLRALARAGLLAVILLGALYAWDGRNEHLAGDSISYLDIADGIAHGHLAAAANAYWSPLYPTLLAGALAFRPSAYWEPLVVRFVNFLIYLGALACFYYFWAPLVECDPAWMILGYAIFAWSSLQMISITFVTPDLLFSALVYLEFGVLQRAIARKSLPLFAAAGLVLGAGYLARSVMFPLALVFLALLLFQRHGIRKASAILLGFAVLAAPLVAAISHSAGHFTFSDEGKITYAIFVQHADFTFTSAGQPLIGVDTPLHPMRLLHAAPDVLDTGSYPLRVTYPTWYDPAHWYAGAKLRFEPRREIAQFESAWRPFVPIFFSCGVLAAGLIVLCLGGCAWRAPNWLTLLWAIAALGAFGLVHVEPRLVAIFVALLWLWFYRGFLGASVTQVRIAILVVAIALLVPLLAMAPQMVFRAARDLKTHQIASTDWEIAATLKNSGLQPGDKIAFVGDPIESYYARLAHLTVSTWIPPRDADEFWALDAAGKTGIFLAMSGAGAKAVVAEDIPPEERSGWQRVGDTSVYIHPLAAPVTGP